MEQKPLKLLIGGSPCTYWSISQKPNKRETSSEGIGWELFRNYLIAKEKFKPDFFLYENNESISKQIQKEIEKNLNVNLLHIDSCLFSAQSRHRIYGTNIKINKEINNKNKELTVRDVIDFNYHKENIIEEVKFKEKNTISKNKYKPIRLGIINKGSQGQRVYSIDGKSCTITAIGGGKGGHTGLYLINNEVRKLNIIETERLQTLPDNYTLCDGISNTQRYKCVGNGWTAEVIIYILSHLDVPKDYPIEVLSMYDGIATGRYCLDQLGYTNIVYKAYEIDPYAIKIALKNYPDIIECGDAFQVRENNWKY